MFEHRTSIGSHLYGRLEEKMQPVTANYMQVPTVLPRTKNVTTVTCQGGPSGSLMLATIFKCMCLNIASSLGYLLCRLFENIQPVTANYRHC